MSGAFLLFGPTENSWAVGNNSWRACQKLPRTYAPHFEDDTFTGYTIQWFAVARNGLHYFSLLGHDGSMPVLRSQDPGIETDTAIGINSAGEPIQDVDFMSFTPGNGYFVRYVDGSVRLSLTGDFPESFHELAAIFVAAGRTRQMSPLELVFFGADGFLATSSAGQILSDGLSEELQKILAHKQADGWSLGKETNLCQWDNTQYFLAWKREIPYSNGQIETSYSWNIKPSGWLTDELLCEVTEGRTPTSHATSPPLHHPAILSIDGPKKDLKPLLLAPDEFIARPIRSYNGSNPKELSFRKGETLLNVRHEADAWYSATNEKGEKGLVLRNNISLWNNPVYFDDGVGYSCDSCKELIVGVFYHCDICQNGDFDICQKCYIGWGNQCYDPGHVLTLKQQLNGRSLTCEDPTWTTEEMDLLLEVLDADVKPGNGIVNKIVDVVDDLLDINGLHLSTPSTPKTPSKPLPKKDISEILELAILTETPEVQWDEIAGLEKAKEEVQSTVILPNKLPHLFRGKRKARKGVLLYGPPGTGKKYLAKAIAADTESKFISLNCRDMVSKWQGDGETIIKTAFERARASTPSVLFLHALETIPNGPLKSTLITEIDSFASTSNLLLASSTSPWTLDPHLRRRFQSKLHIPLPDQITRTHMFGLGVGDTPCQMNAADYARLGRISAGLSASEIFAAVEEVIMVPVNRLSSATHFRQVCHPFSLPFLHARDEDRTAKRKALIWHGQVYTADNVEKLTPCNPYDAGAMPMKWTQIPAKMLLEPPLVAADFFSLVQGIKPGCPPEEVGMFEHWEVEFGGEGA